VVAEAVLDIKVAAVSMNTPMGKVLAVQEVRMVQVGMDRLVAASVAGEVVVLALQEGVEAEGTAVGIVLTSSGKVPEATMMSAIQNDKGISVCRNIRHGARITQDDRIICAHVYVHLYFGNGVSAWRVFSVLSSVFFLSFFVSSCVPSHVE
jgi:hypothetical protein